MVDVSWIFFHEEAVGSVYPSLVRQEHRPETLAARVHIERQVHWSWNDAFSVPARQVLSPPA